MSVNESTLHRVGKRLRYWRERFGNAFWMLRTGRFKLFYQSAYMELYPTVEKVRNQLNLDDRELPDSAFVDKRRVARRGYRPTVAQSASVSPHIANGQIVAGEIRQILATLVIKEDITS